jgi:hypothetical protein
VSRDSPAIKREIPINHVVIATIWNGGEYEKSPIYTVIKRVDIWSIRVRTASFNIRANYDARSLSSASSNILAEAS